MSRILHLSDVHFGAVDDPLVGQLLAIAAELRPDLTVVSGDLTQRARPAQFDAARQFVDRLPQPVIVVPGNHDMPLWNLALRLLVPFSRYARAFGPDTETVATLPDAVVHGVNTANPFVWKAGRLRAPSVARLTKGFALAPTCGYRIAVLHHAPVPAADGTAADIASPAKALLSLAHAKTDIVLSGHTHMPHAGFAETAAGVLFLQVGTAISTRRKTGANDFSVIDLTPERVTVQPYIAPMGGAFAPAPPTSFVRGPAGWRAG